MTVPPPSITRPATSSSPSSGIRVRARDGREFLDCISGTFNLLLGHNHPEVMAAAKAQMDRLVHTGSTYLSEPVEQLGAALVGLPPNLTRVHLRSPGGSTANEGAIRIAQHVTGKRDVITMFRSHLGQTMATIGYSGFAFHRAPFPYVMPGALHVPEPSCSRCFYGQKAEQCELPCVSRIDDFIRYASSGSVACVLIEPIFGVGGNIVPPPRYFPELKRFCEERGIVLIFDEIQTGFGRTGEMFAANYFGVSPHMMTLSKGLTGSGFPLGAILTEERLMGLPRIHHGFTGGATRWRRRRP
ncbi:aminotransferase class III-fold pyridoxal phosphate-dependent enzyme [Cystobacter fuscus]